MSDSIWKKEITLRRTPKEPAPPKPESIWKKEITFRRKPEVEAAELPKPESIWKKEITFRRKPKQAEAVELPAAVQAVLAGPTVETEVEEPPVVSVVEPFDDPPALPPWPEVDAQVEEPPLMSAEPFDDPSASPQWPEVHAVSEHGFLEPWPTPQPEPFAKAVVEPWLAPVEPEHAVPPPSAERFADPSGETQDATELPPVSPPRPEAHVRSESDFVEPSPTSEPEPFSEAVVEPWLAPAELPAEPPMYSVPPPSAVKGFAVPPGETKDARWPEGHVDSESEPVELPTAAEPEPIAEAVVEPSIASAEPAPEPQTSFWKKERSLGRKRKDRNLEDAVAPEAALERTPDVEPKTSFWKKERSLRRKHESESAEDAVAPAEPKAKTSFLKKERSLRPSLPKREPRAKEPKGHDVKRYVGLKVGASQLAAARVANNGAAELLQLAREPLEAGVVVGGEVRDPEALAAALKQFFARNKLPRKNVRLGIASNRIGVRTFDVDGIEDEKQLDNAIRFRAHEVLSIPLDEAVLDYHVVRESVGADGVTSRRVLLVVAYRDLVERYVFACRKAGLTLAGIDLEAFALLRSLSAPRPDDAPPGPALVAVSIGHDRSTFAVSDGRTCEFTRVIEWGGASLNIALARVLDLAPSEVESVKRSLSLASTDVPAGMSPDRHAAAVDAILAQVQGFARELVASLQFYQGQPESLEIGEVVITGGTAGLDGLAAELENLVGVRVRVGDPLARLKVAKKVAADEHVGSLAVAIGLGIED